MKISALAKISLALAATTILTGCHTDMWVQPKVKSQEKSKFFADGKNTRMPVEGTVPVGGAKLDDAYYTGYVDGKLVKEFPVPVTKELIRRGQERYRIFCTHCHGEIGDGKGMIAQRGFTLAQPVGNYHTDRLREMPIGHFYDVINRGYGTMYPFGARIKPEDRWAIAAYIRVLQFSQHAPLEDLDQPVRQKLGVTTAQATKQGPLFTEVAGFGAATQPAPAPQDTTMTMNEAEGGRL
ncbi:MAG: cytochrome c [Fimbriimonadaceae bacterium]|jgi:mono/diheme cytochrome c family protein|nr:cytochrome c [Fimbriimonadaceae bacterium]